MGKAKGAHAICVHGSGRNGDGSLPANFPLDKFLKKMTCKKNAKTKKYDCYFDYDPANFDKRSGKYSEGNIPLVLYCLVGVIFLVIIVLVILYLCCLRKSRGAHGGHSKHGSSFKRSSMKSKKSSRKSSRKSRGKSASKHSKKSMQKSKKSRKSGKKSKKSIKKGSKK